MILLIQLSGVIGPHVTRAPSTSMTINGVCECRCDFMRVTSLSHSHNFDCHFSSDEIRFTYKILTYKAFNLLL